MRAVIHGVMACALLAVLATGELARVDLHKRIDDHDFVMSRLSKATTLESSVTALARHLESSPSVSIPLTSVEAGPGGHIVVKVNTC
jgi:hypothetical protein